VAVGLAASYRAANAFVGGGAAAMASAALLLGQLITFPLAAGDAAIFALAAIAIERGLALTTAGRRGALALLILPSLGPLTAGAGWPSGSKIIDILFCTQHGIAATSAVLWLGFTGALLDRRTTLSLLAVVITASAAFAAVVHVAGVGTNVCRCPAGRRHRSGSTGGAAARCRRPPPAWATAALVAPLLLFNVTLVVVAQARRLPPRRNRSRFARSAPRRRGRRTIGSDIRSPFPATLLFRATTGLPAARFDRQASRTSTPRNPIVHQ
jgi:hypothetical protein